MFCPLIGWMFCPLIGWMFGPLIGWIFGPLIGWMFGIENYLLNSEIYMEYDSRDAKIYLTYWLLKKLVYIQFPKSSVTTSPVASLAPQGLLLEQLGVLEQLLCSQDVPHLQILLIGTRH